MSDIAKRAFQSIARDAAMSRAKGGRRGRPLPQLTVTIGEAEMDADDMPHGVDVPEHMRRPDLEGSARSAGASASDDDDSYRASAAETAGAGATVGDLYDDEDEE